MTESGKPCISAMAEIDSSYLWENAKIDTNYFYADSNGIIWAIYIFPRAIYGGIADIRTIVHKDTSKPWIVCTDTLTYWDEYSNSKYGIPPVEVTFPDDSL